MDYEMKKTILILLALMSLTACSTFNRSFPDNSDVYKQAESLPDLEIPPDLTRDAMSNMMNIPGEGAVANPNAPAPKQAVMQVINGKSIVTVPEEFTIAWSQVEQTLLGSGMEIDGQDQQKGTFDVTYTDETKGSSWFSFMGSNKDSYVISLTGVGDKTELVVLDEDGEWKPTAESDRILSMLMTQYNISRGK